MRLARGWGGDKSCDSGCCCDRKLIDRTTAGAMHSRGGVGRSAKAARASNTCYAGDPDACSSRLGSRVRKPRANPSSLAGEGGYANSGHSSRDGIRGGDRHAPGACGRERLGEEAVPPPSHGNLRRDWDRGGDSRGLVGQPGRRAAESPKGASWDRVVVTLKPH